MPSGNRRLSRTMRSSMTSSVPLIHGDMTSNRYSALGTSVPTLHGSEAPAGPKHFPFPNTPIENDCFFEGLMCIYTVFAAGLQFLHLYRSVWWLPHSYTNHAMKFYLIDINLVIFILIILCRRIGYLLGQTAIELYIPKKMQGITFMSYRLFLFGFMFSTLSGCAYNIIQYHPILNILYLCYPILVYLILFGFNIMPFFELTTYDTIPPMHACSSIAPNIRAEVENLKTNFNNRMKQILFNSIINSYYAGFIPCCFAQNFLFYDIYWATQHVGFIFLGCFCAYAIQILPLRYCDILHRSALHLGVWDRVDTRPILPVAYLWQEDLVWPQGILVRHGKDMYRAHGEVNAAEPGNAMYTRFYSLFKNPSMTLGMMLILQVFLSLYQLGLLVKCTYWHNIISLTFMLFFNYYTLFKTTRDYLISAKIYKAERSLHDKIYL